MSILEQKNIKLRSPEPHDLELLYAWENDPEIWKVSNTLMPYSKDTLKKYISSSHLDIFETKQVRFMIDFNDDDFDIVKTIGTIDLFDFDPHNNRAGVGILIGDKEYRNKGLAGIALELVIEYSFTVLCMHQLYCNIAEDNSNSLRLFKKHGFRVTGKKTEWIKNQNTWIDEFLLQLLSK